MMKRPNYEPLILKGTAMHYILERLSEPSTWRGMVLLLTAFGVQLEPELQTHIIATGLGLVGVINVMRKEKK
jgi:hypothetical protein